MPFLKVWLDDRTVAPENGAQSRRLADLIERHVLTEEPFASLHVPLDAYLANGSNYETVRLIALSDRYLGRDDDYEAIFGSAIEAIKAHPRTYVSGVADVFWQFLMQAPIREGIAPRAQTEPAPPPATYTRDGVVLPNPAATVLVDAVPTGSSGARRTTSTRARSTTRRSSGRTRRRSGATGRSSRRCARGMPSCRPAPARRG